MTLLCLTTRGWCGIGRSRSRSTSAPRDLYRAVPLSRRSPGVDFARLLARDCVCRGDSRCPGARVRCGRFLKVSKTAQNSILNYQHRTARRDRFISTSYLATTGQHSRLTLSRDHENAKRQKPGTPNISSLDPGAGTWPHNGLGGGRAGGAGHGRGGSGWGAFVKNETGARTSGERRPEEACVCPGSIRCFGGAQSLASLFKPALTLNESAAQRPPGTAKGEIHPGLEISRRCPESLSRTESSRGAQAWPSRRR